MPVAKPDVTPRSNVASATVRAGDVQADDVAVDQSRLGMAGFHALVTHTSDVIVLVDRTGVIIDCTPSLAQSLGCEQGAVVGHQFAQFLKSEDAARARQAFADCADGPTRTYPIAEWRLRREEDTAVLYEVAIDDLLDDEHVAAIVLTMRDVSQPRALQDQLAHQAVHDALTGLPNRAAFHASTARELESGRDIVSMVLDIDDFKRVNDTLGHRAGDELLRQVAARLREAVGDEGIVARFAGDEFAILTKQESSGADAQAQRYLRPFRLPFVLAGETTTISASIGIVTVPDQHDGIDASEVLRCADIALNTAKEHGKAQVVVYRDELNTRMLDRATRRIDLQRALKANEFFLQFQPVVALASGEITACEALVRWQHPTRGRIAPNDFIQLAEEAGLIGELGRWVLDAACAQLGEWSAAGHADVLVAVNVSAHQLTEAGFVDDVRAALARSHLPAGRLALELTESVLADDAAGVGHRLRALREVGVRIAMDDFGTGFSSLAYLQKFRFDTLKIDKCFVDGLGTENEQASALVTAIVSLAHSLHMDVVAEGIERASQWDELSCAGTDFGQGYLFSRPVDAQEMSRLLDRQTLGPDRPSPEPVLARLRPLPIDPDPLPVG